MQVRHQQDYRDHPRRRARQPHRSAHRHPHAAGATVTAHHLAQSGISAPTWGTGDSDMYRYAPFCNLVTECSTLRQLERAISDMLEAAS